MLPPLHFCWKAKEYASLCTVGELAEFQPELLMLSLRPEKHLLTLHIICFSTSVSGYWAMFQMYILCQSKAVLSTFPADQGLGAEGHCELAIA